MRKLTEAIQPTLGPTGYHVAVSPVSNGTPEYLDSGGLIARRMLQLPDPREDVGAMYLRNLLWRMHEAVGDGTATTCVLFRAVYEAGLRYLAAGGNAMRLRDHLHASLPAVLADLDCQTTPIVDAAHLRQVARTLTADAALAEATASILGILGEHAQVELRRGNRRGLDTETIEGAYWESAVLSPGMLTNREQQRADLILPHILLSDLAIENPHDLVPVLRLARELDIRSLVLLANRLSDQCLSTLIATRHTVNLDIVAVRTPGVSPAERMAVLADLAVLTGARPLIAGAGATLGGLQAADLGAARRAWADRTHFGIIGGAGTPRDRAAHIGHLTQRYHALQDEGERTALSRRIGNLSGRSAVVRIGGDDDAAIRQRTERGERLVASVRAALRGGVVPGGGWALYRARHAASLTDGAGGPDEEARAARAILSRALEAPIRRIIANMGREPGPLLAALAATGAANTSDTTLGIFDAALSDAAATVKLAVRMAVEGAAQALTIETVVHHRQPEESIHP